MFLFCFDERAIKNRTALHYSAGHGHVDLVQLLIGQGAEIDDPDEDGRTALHYAARYQCILFNNYDTIATSKNTCIGLLSKVNLPVMF